MFIADILDICDPVLTFDRIMEAIDAGKYLRERPYGRGGRPGYNRVNMLKTVLFGFMDMGYASLRELEDRCKVDIRYMYLMDYQRPSYNTFRYFIQTELEETVEKIFLAVTKQIIREERVDLQHLYIDGTKLEANANKYTWVWRKGTEKSRYRLFGKITALLEEMNGGLVPLGVRMQTNTEYVPEQLEEMIERYAAVTGLRPERFARGRGRHKTPEQRYYEKLTEYTVKLREYAQKLRVCGEGRNSYSKTDPDATFMHVRKDHMRNDQLLPAYNIQIGTADEYIAVVDVQQYRSDMDCFIPLAERFYEQYGFYPRYPVADAGYGSYNNYLYCAEHGMEKFMKFPLYEKESKDGKYRLDPFRAVNFPTNETGDLLCPNGRKMLFAYRAPVKGNRYGRQEEIYRCEDCSGCPYAGRCKKGEGNRTVRMNQELTAIHREVLENLNSTHGALLRMNRSIQAEGAFGIVKQDRQYRRIVRRGLDPVRMELFLVSIGYNLYKYHNKQLKARRAA